MSEQDKTIAQLKNDVARLAWQVDEYRKLQKKYERAFIDLKEKEEFNFALFQYNPMTTVIVDREGKVIKSNKAKQQSGDRLPNIGDVMYRDYADKHAVDMYEELMACIQAGEVKTFPQMSYEGKYLTITIAPFSKGAIITTQDVTTRVQAELDRINLIADLRRALDEVETLRGLLPICASCKKIRDDRGYWSTVEEYFSCRSRVDFSHTLCPECIKTLYPDLWEQMPKHAMNRTTSSS
jgi:transcriptional regulator with PAS, ATPase and Fis domain